MLILPKTAYGFGGGSTGANSEILKTTGPRDRPRSPWERRHCSRAGWSSAAKPRARPGCFRRKTGRRFGGITSGGVTCSPSWSQLDWNGPRSKSCAARGRPGQKKVGVDAHIRSAHMGNTVDVNENEYAVASFEQKLAAVRLLETAILQNGAGGTR